MKNLMVAAIQILIGAVVWLILKSGAQAQGAGRIVVSHDDWVLQDDGFHEPADPGRFALNVADWFTGGRPGKFLASSAVPSLEGSTLANVMASAGHNWLVSSSVPSTLGGLLA